MRWVENIGVQEGREATHALFEPELLVVRCDLVQDFTPLPIHLALVPKNVLGSDAPMRAHLTIWEPSLVQLLDQVRA